MKKIIGAMVVATALGSAAASATTYNEDGDAGHTALTAQSVKNGTTQIKGAMSITDSVDLFKFKWNGGNFSASTTNITFDTMLFLFDQDGNTLAFNDDYSGLASYISRTLSAGDYMLAINAYSYNYGGNLAGFAGAPSVPGRNGTYTINLSQVDSTDVPEPSTLGLLGLAAIGLGLARRRKQA